MRLTASTEVVAVMGSIQASSDTGESEGRQMNKEQKNPDQKIERKRIITLKIKVQGCQFFIPI